jgi:putative transposase
MYRTGKARPGGPGSLLEKHRDIGAAKRFLRWLLDEHELPERVATDELTSYGAALRETPELTAANHVVVSAAERQNNFIEQSHRPTQEQEQQQQSKGMCCAQRFLFTHAKVTFLFHCTRAQVHARLSRSESM